MIQSGTPCPYNGKIGAAALDEWKKYDKLRPDYERYVADLKVIDKKNAEIEKEQLKVLEENKELITQQQLEMKKIQEEKQKLLNEIDGSKKKLNLKDR